MNRRKWSALFLTILLAVGLARQPLIAQDELHPAQAIVVIGGDHKPERLARAAELYRAGYAPIVILSAGTMAQEGTEWLPEAQVMRRQALGLGIPPDVIMLEQSSQSTVQNAIYTRAILQAHNLDSILLVTSPYHSRRARQVFADLLGHEMNISVQPGWNSNFCSVCWPVQIDQQTVVLSEYWKWLVYLVAHQ